MLYPSQFPSDNNNHAERVTFEALSKLNPDEFDIFFHRKFSALNNDERIEYEADYIIADLRNKRINGILVVEVKGGKLEFDGESLNWTQSGRKMDISPTTQSSSIMHSLIKRYAILSENVPFGWAVWFPDQINPGQKYLPTELNENQYFDRLSLGKLEDSIKFAFTHLYSQWSFKRGDNLTIYNLFKDSLIRSLGYTLPLHKSIEAAESRFLELTERQLNLLRLISSNPNILISGPAGSGKTIMATTIAREQSDAGAKVLFLTFNRVLANNIRYSLGKLTNPEVYTYHSLARKYIDQFDKDWWQNELKDSEFWELGVPMKLYEVLKTLEPEYDYIIIDEAQDIRDEWLETLDLLVKPSGGFFIFLDVDQDIFHAKSTIIQKRSFFRFELTENCRNTVSIVNYLKSLVNRKIDYKFDAVPGEPVRIIEYRNDIEQMNLIKNEWLNLVENEGLNPKQILIIMNADKRKSCLSNIAKFGKYKIESLYGRTGQLAENRVNYTSINTFKGLEVDIAFIIDTDKVDNPDFKVLYTQASRAKYMLLVFKKV